MLGIDFVKVEVTAGLIAQFNIGSAASTPSGGSVCTCSLQSLMPGASSPATALPTPSQDECALILGIDDLGLPDVDLALLYVSTISLGDICTYLLDVPLGSDFGSTVDGLTLNDILIYWCDDVPGSLPPNMTLPNGSAIAYPAFMFQGGIDCWSDSRHGPRSRSSGRAAEHGILRSF